MDTIPKNNLLDLVQDALNTNSTSSALVVQTSLTITTIYASRPIWMQVESAFEPFFAKNTELSITEKLPKALKNTSTFVSKQATRHKHIRSFENLVITQNSKEKKKKLSETRTQHTLIVATSPNLQNHQPHQPIPQS